MNLTRKLIPSAAGIGFTVPLKTKEEDFLGKAAIQHQAAASRHKLVGLVLDQTEPAAHGDLVYAGRFPVGVVTSATNSPLLKNKSLYAVLHLSMLQSVQKLKLASSTVNKKTQSSSRCLTFYDPERTRVRS